MGTNVKQFNLDIRRAARKIVGLDFVTFHKSVIFQLLQRIVDKTPVDTGRLRGGWQTSVGQPSEAQGNPSKTGDGPFIRAQKALESLRPYQTAYISNNVAYVRYIEEGTGHRFGFSDQAPQGMVAISLQEVELLFQKVL